MLNKCVLLPVVCGNVRKPFCSLHVYYGKKFYVERFSKCLGVLGTNDSKNLFDVGGHII